MSSQSIQKTWWLLLAIIVLGVGVRSYQITEPDITDFHAWRQTDTAAFTHGYLVQTLNPFYPSVDRYPCDLRDEPFGRVEAELPVVGWLAALPLAAMGVDFPPPWYLRAVSILFFVLTCIYLFLMVLRLGGDDPEALLAVLAFAALPFSIFFTRTVQPDGPSLFFGVAFLYHLLLWLEDDRTSDGVLSGVFCALVLLLKISNGYLVFPALYLFISRKGLLGALKTPKYWAWGIAVLVPIGAWSLHAYDFPWTFGVWGHRSGTKFTNMEALTRPEIWRQLSSRLTFDILTWAGVAFVIAGLTRFHTRELARFAGVWLAGFLFFVALTLNGNHTHIYYQLPLVLPAAILIGVGVPIVWRQKLAGKLAVGVAVIVYTATTYHILFGERGEWQNGYFHDDVPGSIQRASELIEKNLAPGQKFVSTSRHPALFFNSRHRGYFYEGGSIRGFVGCTGPDAPYLLLDGHDRRRAQRAMRRDRRLEGRLREVGRAGHYSLWEVREATSSVTYLQPQGGSGGNSFSWECPEGQALRGFDAALARDDKFVGSLKPICGGLDGAEEGKEGRWLASHKPKAEEDATRLECPTGTVAVGFDGHVQKLLGTLRLTCAKPESTDKKKTAPVGPQKGKAFSLECPEGTVMVGVHGRSGLFVDALGATCDEPSE